MRTLATISLLVNLLLAGVVVQRYWAAPRASGSRTGLPSEVTNRQLRVGRHMFGAPVQRPAPVTIEVLEPFHWAQLESQDYREYVANLRAIGCPEATVRDIILADVRDLYARKVKDLIASETARFWDLLSDKEGFEKTVDQKHKELTRLDDEQDELLEALLGVSGRQAGTDDAHEEALVTEANRAALDFLTPETAQRVLALEQKYRQLESHLNANAGKLSAADRETRRQEILDQKNQELALLLTPAELEEYQLRRSPALGRVGNLASFSASETELKALVRLREREAERAAEIAREKNVDERARLTATLQAQSREELKSLLGEERFAEYERARDFRYQQTYALVTRQGHSADYAARIYDLEREAKRRSQQIRNDASLQGDGREEALVALRNELRASVAGVLGNDAELLFQRVGLPF